MKHLPPKTINIIYTFIIGVLQSSFVCLGDDSYFDIRNRDWIVESSDSIILLAQPRNNEVKSNEEISIDVWIVNNTNADKDFSVPFRPGGNGCTILGYFVELGAKKNPIVDFMRKSQGSTRFKNFTVSKKSTFIIKCSFVPFGEDVVADFGVFCLDIDGLKTNNFLIKKLK